MALKEHLDGLAANFAQALMDAIMAHPLSDLMAEGVVAPERVPNFARQPAAPKTPKASKGTSAAAGRLVRRTSEQIAEAAAQIAALLKKEGPMRAEDIRKALDLDVREVPRLLKEGVASKAFAVLSGQKRSTTYGLKGSKAPVAKVAKSSKKALKKAAKAAKRSAKKAPAKKRPAKALKKPARKAAPKAPKAAKAPVASQAAPQEQAAAE